MHYALLARVNLKAKIADDKLLALLGVLAHVVFQDIVDACIVLNEDRFEMNFLADEGAKLIR